MLSVNFPNIVGYPTQNTKNKNYNQTFGTKQKQKPSSPGNLDTDKFEHPTKKKSKKGLWITLGAIATVMVGSVLYSKHYQTKFLERAQKTFQDVFMRDDISKEETIEIIKRYKEIEKIKDKKEYANALFLEAKRNFGFENLKNCRMCFDKNGDYFIGPNSAGNTSLLEPEIVIRSTLSKEDLMETIHHEMRHVKQNYYIINYDIDESTKILETNKKYDFVKYNKNSFETFWGIKFDKSNVPEKYREFAKKCLESHKNYIKAEVDEVGYRKQFVEEDAYKAGNSMEDLLIKSVVPDYTNYKVK